MSRHQFSVAYEGRPFDEGRIDVRELAPSMLALADLITRANELVNAKDVEVHLDVIAHAEGSFKVNLDLNQSLRDKLVGVIGGNNTKDAEEIIALLFGLGSLAIDGGTYVWGVLQWLRGNKVTEVKREQNGSVTMYAEAGASITMGQDVYICCQDIRIRKDLEDMGKPAFKEGCTGIRVSDSKSRGSVVLTRDNLAGIATAGIGEAAEVVADVETTMAFQILSPAFQKDNKWRVRSGTESLYVTMGDEEFSKSVEGGREFSAKDVLVCLVRMVQSVSDGRLSTEYTILNVKNHIKPPKQSLFPFPDSPQE